MVSPTGVNEGVPQEPGPAGTVPDETRPTGTVPPPAKPADEETAAAPAPEDAEVEPAEGVHGKAELAEADDAAAQPAEAEHAEAQHAEAEHAEAEHAAAELAEGQHAEAELAEAGETGLGAEEQSRDVSRLAVAGIILVAIALVGAAVGVLAIVTHGFRPKTVITYRPAAVFGLRAGECINSAANALNVTVLSCASPHDAEVFAVFSLPGGAWPGASLVQLDASDGCVNRFDSYVNPQLASADLNQEYVYPDQTAWQAGERTVICEVRAASGQLTGSVRAQS